MLIIRGITWRAAAKHKQDRSVWSPTATLTTASETVKFGLNVRLNDHDSGFASVYVYPRQPEFKCGKKLQFTLMLAPASGPLGAQLSRSAVTSRDMLAEHFRRCDGLGYGQFVKLTDIKEQFYDDTLRLLLEIDDTDE